ncbi:distal membrane-arm assembly complex protein 1 [Pristis pectinata]|uniref:distal membrane-arm assembly complex protein 1 n=1 Tax=Pristis pectinata TaxID=685728 RepID=UPI00223D8AB6|nr:distal membrane-arm assembly complex protein 1 [Pristis pectinata]
MTRATADCPGEGLVPDTFCVKGVRRFLTVRAAAARRSMAAPEKSEAAAPPPRLFNDCWGCRLVCGGGLIGAGGYVYASARKVMQKGGPTGMGTVGQIVFALGLLSLGLVVMVDPVNKSHPKY